MYQSGELEKHYLDKTKLIWYNSRKEDDIWKIHFMEHAVIIAALIAKDMGHILL
jgi:hypothetical protein